MGHKAMPMDEMNQGAWHTRRTHRREFKEVMSRIHSVSRRTRLLPTRLPRTATAIRKLWRTTRLLKCTPGGILVTEEVGIGAKIGNIQSSTSVLGLLPK